MASKDAPQWIKDAVRRFAAMFLLGTIIVSVFIFPRLAVSFWYGMLLAILGGLCLGLLGALFGAFLDLDPNKRSNEKK
jgi:uncharacterized membrane protein YdjX (TVP38/TMEM64 family)